jgi:hypothetical protein
MVGDEGGAFQGWLKRGAVEIEFPVTPCYVVKMSPSKNEAKKSEGSVAADLISTDRDYEAWAKAKIEKALDEAKQYPERRIPLDKVWKKFGLEH